MARVISFTKMHGIGNDFIVVDDFFPVSPNAQPAQTSLPPTPLNEKIARAMCDRRFGIGADQILWLKPAQAKSSDFRMDILNADGSVAEMCGNGIRAAVLYFHDRFHSRNPARNPGSQKNRYEVETLAGLKWADVHGRNVRVDMGEPRLLGGFPQQGEDLEVGPQGSRKKLSFFEVSMGNPHAVFFTDEPIEKYGAEIETHSRFPERTNVEFVKVEGPQTIRVRVWERGAGITLACGTGACASAVASLATKRVQSPVTVKLPGGDLLIHWNGQGPILMEGPAEEVFSGQYPIAD
jgi:diaminopimelate epimerase